MGQLGLKNLDCMDYYLGSAGMMAVGPAEIVAPRGAAGSTVVVRRVADAGSVFVGKRVAAGSTGVADSGSGSNFVTCPFGIPFDTRGDIAFGVVADGRAAR